MYTCVFSFWYHMYGAKVNRLNLISVNKDLRDTETVVWTRAGNLGPEWKHGQVQFKPPTSGNYKFVFEGIFNYLHNSLFTK